MRAKLITQAVVALLILASGSASAKRIFVDAAADPSIADGSRKAPFATISAAVARAQVASTSDDDDDRAVVIHIEEGIYSKESWPIQLGKGLRLVGETELVRDYRGLPTGARRMSQVLGGASQMFRIADDDVAIEGLDLQGTGLTELIHVDGSGSKLGGIEELSIMNNILERGFIRTKWASGTIAGNLLRDGGGVSGLIKGGPADHPARIRFRRNRVTGDFFNGIHFDGDMGDPSVSPSAIELRIEENDFSNNGSAGLNVNNLPQFGAGAQFFIDDANDANLGSEQHIDARIDAVVANNTFVANQNYGVVMGGRLRSPKSTGRVRFFGEFSGNAYCGNGNNAGMFGFAFFARSLKYNINRPGYIKATTSFFGNSEYHLRIDDDDGLAQAFDYDNPDADPGNGTLLENSLLVNDSGKNLAGTSISAFKKAASCTPPPSDGDDSEGQRDGRNHQDEDGHDEDGED